MQLLMLAGYLGSFAIRTLLIGRPVIPFEVVQSIGVLVIAFGGAIALIRSTGSNVLVGVASIVLATAGYLVAFAFVERRRHVRNFFFYAVLAQLFAIVGIALCGGQAWGAVVYTFAAFLPRHWHDTTDAWPFCSRPPFMRWLRRWHPDWPSRLRTPCSCRHRATRVPFLSFQLLALSAVGVVAFLPVRRAVEEIGGIFWAHAPTRGGGRAGVDGCRGSHLSFDRHAARRRPSSGGSLLATIGKAVLVSATLALAEAARHPAGREARWLGLSMLFSDRRESPVHRLSSGPPRDAVRRAGALWNSAHHGAPHAASGAAGGLAGRSSRDAGPPESVTVNTVAVVGEPTLKMR